MSRKSILICVLIAALAYVAGARGASEPKVDRPVLRWISRAVGVWLLFRQEPPPQQDNARYVHTIGPDAIDHRNAL